MIEVHVYADRAIAFLRGLIGRWGKSAEESVEETLNEIKRQMSVSGKPIVYPVQWDSEKQRRAFFATDGFGAGIPYRRTDAYVNGWKIAKMPSGLSLSNAHPAGAIGGTLTGKASGAMFGASLTSWQSKIHRGRWPAFLPIVLEELTKLPRKIIDRMTIRTK